MSTLAFKWQPSVAKALRYYQEEAIAAAFDCFSSVRSVLIELPTGAGKTFTASELVRRWPGRPVIWTAHTEELCLQAREELESVTGESVGWEKAGEYSTDADSIIVASIQTIATERRARSMRPPSLIVIDEAHRAEAKSYKALRRYWPEAKVVLLTATPKFKGELSDVCDEVAYRYTIKQAIDDGVWPRLTWKQKRIAALNVDALKVSAKLGDFTDQQLAKVMHSNAEQILQAYAHGWHDFGEDRKTIAFLPSVDLAVRFAGILNHDHPGLACAIHGQMETIERRRTVDAFKRGDHKILCNVGVVAEGFNDPNVTCVLVGRMTASWIRYCQMIGRARGGKERESLILDFTPASAKHKLVSPIDVLADSDADATQDVRDRATRSAQDGARPQDAIEQAKQDEQALKLRELEMLRTARERYKVRAEFVDRDAPNPLDMFHVRDPAILNDHNTLNATRASDAQIERLKKKKIPVPDVLTAKQATHLERTAFARRKAGLCSMGTVALLAKYGENAISWRPETASRAIEAIKANGWKPLTKREPGGEG